MPRHCCIVGGGAALAQPLIAKWLMEGHKVTAVCRNLKPDQPECSRLGERFRVVDNLLSVEEGVNLLVTMPGATADGKLGELSVGLWASTVNSCLTVVAGALNGLKLADGANVVVVGSIVGSTGGYGCSAYAAAKAGLVGLVRAAANEWASRDICVNLLELGYVNAGMGARLDPKVRERVLAGIPLKRFAEPHEVVEAVEFLGRTRYMTGGILNLAGGLR